jgi:hypothetical protein
MALHVGVVAPIFVLIGSAIGFGIGYLTTSVHYWVTGPDRVYDMGVWTLPNALLVRLLSGCFWTTIVVWPLVGSSLIVLWSRQWMSPLERVFGRGRSADAIHTPDEDIRVPHPLRHCPLVTRDGRFNRHNFNNVISRSITIFLVTFAFAVMPTCTMVTVLRESKLSGVRPRPLRCQDMNPPSYPPEGYGISFNGVVFESLCWDLGKTLMFDSIWAAVYGAVLGAVSAFSAIFQFGQKDHKIHHGLWED